MRLARSTLAPTTVFVALSCLYLCSGEFVPTNDCKPLVFQPVVLLSSHAFVFTPHNAPFMFDWRFQTGHGEAAVAHRAWRFEDAVPPRAELERQGLLRAGAEHYYLAPTQKPREYLNIYGPVPGLMLLPAFAVLHAVFGDLRLHPELIWHCAKAVVALLTALTAAVLFAAARRWVPASQACLAALTFALGTMAWPNASQTPSQQSFALLWLALGLWAAPRAQQSLRAASACGVSLGLAASVRPTMALFALAMGLWLMLPALEATLRKQSHARAAWRTLFAYGLAGIAPLALLAAFNWHFFGSVVGFTQMQRVRAAVDPWQTPLWLGAYGLLLSPSRGLLVYSPVLAFAAYGAVRAFRDRRWAALRPFAVAALATFAMYSKWTAWWGGWSYGPRMLLDVVPVACVLLLPAWEGLARLRAARVLLVVSLTWSVLTAALGALTYDLFGWNAREAYSVTDPRTDTTSVFLERAEAEAAAGVLHAAIEPIRMDIDAPRFHQRLWTWHDSPLVYYSTHFAEARARRRTLMRLAIEDPWR